jgi:hypothetical protein
MSMASSATDYERQMIDKEFVEIRKRYTDILRQMIDKYDVLPEWAFNPAASCGCGDKCSVGKTDLNRMNQVLPAEKEAG